LFLIKCHFSFFSERTEEKLTVKDSCGEKGGTDKPRPLDWDSLVEEVFRKELQDFAGAKLEDDRK
jgi:hypothetical protein